MILIDTLYIHQGGGKTLIEFFLLSLDAHGVEYTLLLDDRIELSLLKTLESVKYVIRIKPSEYQRLIFYNKYNSRFKAIFCLANVPPPVKINNANVYIYFHNTLLLSSIFERNGYKVLDNLKFCLKRIYIILKNSREYDWIVQTHCMKFLLGSKLFLSENKISVLPFFKVNNESIYGNIDIKYKFIYVADGVNQKNHGRLLSAFEMLHENGFNPSLVLTVPRNFILLQNRIRQLKDRGLNIENFEALTSDELKYFYTSSQFLIFPSLKESFGLPLIEAASYNCNVIASDLPYVHEIISPSDIFDPTDLSSIYNCLLRNLDGPSKCTTTIKVSNRITDLIKFIISNEKPSK